jgi:hypothetical protein
MNVEYIYFKVLLTVLISVRLAKVIVQTEGVRWLEKVYVWLVSHLKFNKKKHPPPIPPLAKGENDIRKQPKVFSFQNWLSY